MSEPEQARRRMTDRLDRKLTYANVMSTIAVTASRPFRSFPGADPTDNTRPVDGEVFNAWRVSYRNPPGGTGAATGIAWAICAQT